MQCSEARSLIDAGILPGSTDPTRAALGFHLGRCAACRAYRNGATGDALLAELLGVTPDGFAATVTPPPLQFQRGMTRQNPVTPPKRPFWHLPVVLVLAVMALGLGLMAGRVARAAYTIQGNLAAMQVTAAPRNTPPSNPLAATPTLTIPLANPATVPDAPVALTTAASHIVASPTQGNAATLATIEPVAPLATSEANLPDHVSAALPVPSVTPLRLPPIGGGAAPVPTLMATVGVAPMSGEPVNILLLGSDRRPGEGWQSRSDAIMLVRLEPDRQRIALLSFPRDLIVNIPGVGYYRINSSTVYGEMYPQLGGGLELARRTMSELIDLPIHHVIRADFGAFISAVDAIGGIEIDVEQELYDPAYPTIDYGYMVAHFLPGRQTMDGSTALIYSRLRHADSDYARARRQQQVIQAIMQRILDEHMLGQVQMLTDLSTALRDDIQTDLPFEQMLGMAWSFRTYSPANIERYTLNESLTSMGLPGDQYAIMAQPGAINLVRSQLLGE